MDFCIIGVARIDLAGEQRTGLGTRFQTVEESGSKTAPVKVKWAVR